MLKFVVRRLLALVPILFAVTVIAAGLVEFRDFDAAQTLTAQPGVETDVERVRENLGLDDPFAQRYVSWVGDAAQGDLGRAFSSGRPVTTMIAETLPVTLAIAGVALLIALVLGLSAGVAAALKPNSIADRAVSSISALLMSVPPFAVALVLIILFAVNRSWFPATGYASLSEGFWEWLRHVTLPAFALAGVPAAEIARQSRGALVDSLENDYIRTAYAKGLSRTKVIAKHGARMAAIPVVTVIGLQAPRLIGGAVVVETVFAIPGFGQLSFDAVLRQDMPVIQGVVLVSALVVVVVNLLTDLSYGYLDPRIRTSERA